MEPTYEWRLVHDGVGKTPNVRVNACQWTYKGDLWVALGAGSGHGKASDVWRFDATSKTWSQVSVTGDSPTGRDGQSSTHIGEGKFVVFGGQGFAEPNKKVGKETENMRTQTHWKRDVFNDLWLFDCEASRWMPIYPDGLSFPMGRRGHSAISVDGLAHCPGRCLLVFGGAGIELSKYTEQLYNDLWAYSFADNMWHRCEARGLEPAPLTDHRVARCGDFMVVVGGLSSPKSGSPSPTETPSNSDVLVLNLQTFTWTAVPLTDTLGRPVRLNLFGFSLVPDTTVPQEVSASRDKHHHSHHERSSNPLDSQRFFVYGGKQIVDSKLASTSKMTKIEQSFRESVLLIDLKDGTLLEIATVEGVCPVARYSQMSFSSRSAEEVDDTPPPKTPKQRLESRRSSHRPGSSSSAQFDLYGMHTAKEVPAEETVMFVFGGCALEWGGYCDPQLFSLVKRNPSHEMVTLHNMKSFRGDHLPPMLASPSIESNAFTSFRTNSDESFHKYPDDNLPSSPSIWVSLQNKQYLGNYDSDAVLHRAVKPPSNWEEMKLSLTSSHSERVFERPGTQRAVSRSKTPHSESNLLTGQRPMTTSCMLPTLSLADVDFAYRSVASHNQGSPRSPWHLPMVNLDDTAVSREITRSFSRDSFTEDRLANAKNGLTSPSKTALFQSQRQTPNNDLTAEKRKRIQHIKKTLKPIMGTKTKVAAREFQKLFAQPYDS